MIVPYRNSALITPRGGLQQGDDGVHVVDASAPDASTGLHQRGPQTSVLGKRGMGSEIGTRWPRLQTACAFVRAKIIACLAHQVDGPGQSLAVDNDFDLVAILQLADCASGKGFGRDMPYACARGYAAEAGIG